MNVRPAGATLRESRRQSAHNLPRIDDVVVTRESRSTLRFTVRQLPGPPQFGGTSRDVVVHLARRFAQAHAIDLWYSEAGAYRLLESYRVDTSK